MRTVDAAGLAIGDRHPPRIMGVLNVSEESPYDPSVFADPGAAAAYVDEELIEAGADVVDVGLESANRRYDVLSADQELDRLDVAVETMASTNGDAVWSIETRYHEVAEAALDAGFEMVNDVCGFADPEMPTVCAEYDVAVVKMASPPDLDRPGAVEEGPWATGRGGSLEGGGREGREGRKDRESREESGGVDRDGEGWPRSYPDDVYDALAQNGFTEKTILDPAFGRWSDAKTLADDRETFARLREFTGYGRPLLVSINRKNFLKDVAGRDTDGALPVSLAATAMAVERGADLVRTHDVAATRDAALVGHEFRRDRVDDPAAGVAELDVTTDREFTRHLDRVAGSDTPPEPDGDDPGPGEADGRPSVVTHVLELALDQEAAAYVAGRAEEAGVRVYGGDGLLVAGTAAELRSLRAAVRDGPDAAVRALESACNRLQEV